MSTRTSRLLRPEVTALEGRLALSHAGLPPAHEGATVAVAARQASASGSFHGDLAGKVHAIYILQPGQEAVDVSINAAGRSPKLGRYGVSDFLMTDFDGYNGFMYNYPGIAHYQGALRFDDGPTLRVDWTVHSYRKDGARTFPIRMEGVILSESGDRPIGEIRGEGHLKVVNFDRFAQLYALDARLSGRLAPPVA